MKHLLGRRGAWSLFLESFLKGGKELASWASCCGAPIPLVETPLVETIPLVETGALVFALEGLYAVSTFSCPHFSLIQHSDSRLASLAHSRQIKRIKSSVSSLSAQMRYWAENEYYSSLVVATRRVVGS